VLLARRSRRFSASCGGVATVVQLEGLTRLFTVMVLPLPWVCYVLQARLKMVASMVEEVLVRWLERR